MKYDIYSHILDELIEAIKDDPQILQNTNLNIRLVAAKLDEPPPKYLPKIKRVGLWKVSPRTAAKQIAVECTDVSWETSYKCYETIFEAIDKRDEIPSSLIFAVASVVKEWKKEENLLKP